MWVTGLVIAFSLLHNETSIFNSLWPRSANWCHGTWSRQVQVIAYLLSGAKPSPELMVTYYPLDPQHISSKFQFKCKLVFQENAIENVICKMSAISFRPKCINQQGPPSGVFSWLWKCDSDIVFILQHHVIHDHEWCFATHKGDTKPLKEEFWWKNI